MNAETIVLGARDLARYLAIRDCVDAVDRTLRAHEAGKSRGPASSGFTLPGGSFHAKLAAIEDDGRLFVAVKANMNLPGNPSRHGQPTIQGALILLDGDDGRPLAIMDSIALTSIRTAAVAAPAADHLALSDLADHHHRWLSRAGRGATVRDGGGTAAPGRIRCRCGFGEGHGVG